MSDKFYFNIVALKPIIRMSEEFYYANIYYYICGDNFV